ncbi:MAG TPA: DUF3465 domain-containing protein [Stenomitos sp.]
MRSTLQKVWLGVALTAVIGLVGCGTPTTLSTARVATTSTQLEALAVPPQSAFKTFDVVVTKILPDDNSGLTHQNFVVKTVKSGEIYNVNNSTTHGSEVVGLHVGENLEIRGVVYKDTKSQGIHWTHHADKPGDAGWIKDEDGKVFE